MSALTRLRLPIAILIAVIFAALLALAAWSSTAEADHSWQNYHWARTSNPFTLKLGDNLSGIWDSNYKTTSKDYLSIASTDWTSADPLNTQIVPGGTSEPKGKDTQKQCNPTDGMVEVCNADYGYNGWSGLAQIWLDGDHIVQGIAKLNDSYLNNPRWYSTSSSTPQYRLFVLCQEVGHTFGLDHQDENRDNRNLGTCMDYTRDPDGTRTDSKDPWGSLSNEHPNQGDYNQLLCIYDPAKKGQTLSTPTHSCKGTGDLDSTTTVGNTSAARNFPSEANRGDRNTRADWGRLVRSSPDRQLQKYELDVGQGKKVITFVIWHPNERPGLSERTDTGA